MSARLKSRFTVYQFLVRLRGFKPTIWRRLRVADCTLGELHRVIQACFRIPAAEPFRFVRRDRRAGKAGLRRPCCARATSPIKASGGQKSNRQQTDVAEFVRIPKVAWGVVDFGPAGAVAACPCPASSRNSTPREKIFRNS